MAGDISSTRACPGSGRFRQASREPIACSPIWSLWASEAAARRGAIGRRAARPARVSHLARSLPHRVRLVRPRRPAARRVQPVLFVNVVDWVVLVGTMVGIAAYGAWRTRDIRSLNTYLRGRASTGWGTIGVSVM